MNRVEGISIVYSYSSESGIALFSMEPPEGAIAGGSGNEGAQTQATRIRWWIIEDNSDPSGYSGGITGMGWFQNVQDIDGPFDDVTLDTIYTYAQDGNLDEIFGPWNSLHSGSEDTTIQKFVIYLKDHGAGGCVIEGGLGS